MRMASSFLPSGWQGELLSGQLRAGVGPDVAHSNSTPPGTPAPVACGPIALRARDPHVVAMEIIEQAEAGIRSLMGIPEEYAVLFLQGGASLQFAMIPMNLRRPGKSADYVDTGTWAFKALAEARISGRVNVACGPPETVFPKGGRFGSA
jgi:hypothetical protein